MLGLLEWLIKLLEWLEGHVVTLTLLVVFLVWWLLKALGIGGGIEFSVAAVVALAAFMNKLDSRLNRCQEELDAVKKELLRLHRAQKQRR